MKFTVTLSKDDFLHFNKFAIARVQKSSGLKWKIGVFNFLSWFLLAFFVLEIYAVYHSDCCNNYDHLNRALVAAAIWFVMANVWQHVYLRLSAAAGTDEKGSTLGKWQMEISDVGITEANDLCSSTFTWKSILSVERDEHNLYVFTDSLKAFILPFSQINSEIESEINRRLASGNNP